MTGTGLSDFGRKISVASRMPSRIGIITFCSTMAISSNFFRMSCEDCCAFSAGEVPKARASRVTRTEFLILRIGFLVKKFQVR